MIYSNNKTERVSEMIGFRLKVLKQKCIEKEISLEELIANIGYTYDSLYLKSNEYHLLNNANFLGKVAKELDFDINEFFNYTDIEEDTTKVFEDKVVDATEETRLADKRFKKLKNFNDSIEEFRIKNGDLNEYENLFNLHGCNKSDIVKYERIMGAMAILYSKLEEESRLISEWRSEYDAGNRKPN